MSTTEWADPLAEPGATPRAVTADWSPGQHQRYLDSREQVEAYDPAAEYGDPGWREPGCEREAEARAEHLTRHQHQRQISDDDISDEEIEP